MSGEHPLASAAAAGTAAPLLEASALCLLAARRDQRASFFSPYARPPWRATRRRRT